MVQADPLDENKRNTGDRASSKEPLPVAELQIRYYEAVRDAYKKQKDLLAQIEQDQLDERTKLEWASYWRLRDWVRELDVEAPGIQEELEKAKVDLSRLEKDEIAADVGTLANKCSDIDRYRFLMNLQQKNY